MAESNDDVIKMATILNFNKTMNQHNQNHRVLDDV